MRILSEKIINELLMVIFAFKVKPLIQLLQLDIYCVKGLIP